MWAGNLAGCHITEILSLRWLIYAGMVATWPTFANVSVPLVWNPSVDANVSGYKIYYGVKSHAYTNSVNVGNVTNASVDNLAANTTYYFAATTYDVSGDESDFSNEAKIGIAVVNPPTLNPISNLTVHAKTTTTIVLTGISSGLTGEKKFKITATTSNPKIVSKPGVKYSSPKTTATLTIKAGSITNAMATICLTFNNGAISNNLISRTFTVTVEPPVPPTKKFIEAVDFNPPVNPSVNLQVKPQVQVNPAAILTPGLPVGGQFTLNVAGMNNGQYVVQASTNLMDWVSVQTNAAPFIFVDPDTRQFNQRFYRAVTLP